MSGFCEVVDCYTIANWFYSANNDYLTYCENHAAESGYRDRLLESLDLREIHQCITNRLRTIESEIKKKAKNSIRGIADAPLINTIKNWKKKILSESTKLKLDLERKDKNELLKIMIQLNYFKPDYNPQIVDEFWNYFHFATKLNREYSICMRKVVSVKSDKGIFVSEYVINENGAKFIAKSFNLSENQSREFIDKEIEFVRSKANNPLFFKFVKSIEFLMNGNEVIYFTEYRGKSLNKLINIGAYKEFVLIEFFNFIKALLNSLTDEFKIEYLDPTMIKIDSKIWKLARIPNKYTKTIPEYKAPDTVAPDLKIYYSAVMIAIKYVGLSLSKSRSTQISNIANNKNISEPLKNYFIQFINEPKKIDFNSLNNIIRKN